MKKIVLASLLGVMSVGFFACDNGAYDANPDTNNSSVLNPLDPKANDPVNILTSGKWKVVSVLLINTDTTEFLNSVAECEKDDIYTFKTDKNVETDEGPTKCNAGDPQTSIESTWDIIDNGKKFVSNSSENSYTADIITLNTYEFKLSQNTVNFSGEPITLITRYVRP